MWTDLCRCGMLLIGYYFWVCWFFFFFFSSRRRHTRFDCDWSSDVCSSDLVHPNIKATFNQRELGGDFDTFANGLRAALRQAPKVILVGEMRDRETAELCMK